MRVNKWLATGAGIAGASYATYVARTWMRYGRVERDEKEADELLDRVLPEPEVCERHAIAIDAPPDVTIAAAKDADMTSSRIIRAIFKARELILRGSALESPPSKGLLADMKAMGWGVLAESAHEIVLGGVTKPWEPNPVFRTLSAAEFVAFSEPDYVKIAWTLRADETADGGSIFRTETRAAATDPGARRKFRAYWAFLSPGIILIRRAMLPGVKAEAERRWHLTGDDILPDARTQLTHAITIDASPEEVWPWLVQMGGQRAGWYSWDFLDNGGVRSADHIVPDLQHLSVGDVIPAKPTGKDGFKVLYIEPNRALVLSGAGEDFDGTWAFVLEPVGSKQTRLVTRYRAAYAPSGEMTVKVPLMAAAHWFMERKQLRTIKHHVEHAHVS